MMRPVAPARAHHCWFSPACPGSLMQPAIPTICKRASSSESNSVHKAKLFEKLGDEQLAETRRASQASDFATVGQIMEKYRDNARAASTPSKKSTPTPSASWAATSNCKCTFARHFANLTEMLLLALPPNSSRRWSWCSDDLASIDDELLRMLFPPRPGQKNPAPRSAEAVE